MRRVLKGKGKKELQVRTIGVIGAARHTGVTHFAVMTGVCLSGVFRRRTCVLEWNSHGDFKRMGKLCRKKESGSGFCLLGVDYYGSAGTEELLLCKTGTYQEIIVDYGAVWEGHMDQFLQCDCQFVLGSLTEWQAGAFLEFAEQWKTTKISWQTLAAFGSEESRKNLEKRLGISILRIPVSADAFVVTGELLEFYERILGKRQEG